MQKIVVFLFIFTILTSCQLKERTGPTMVQQQYAKEEKERGCKVKVGVTVRSRNQS